jgi:hypothetical protein
VRAAEAQLARGSQDRAGSTEELERQKARMQELVGKSREVIETLRTVETDRTAVKRDLASREQALKVCVDRNRALYTLNGEVLERLAREAGSSIEPFTRLKRVQLENLVEDYRFRADEQRAPDAPPSGVAPPATSQ